MVTRCSRKVSRQACIAVFVFVLIYLLIGFQKPQKIVYDDDSFFLANISTYKLSTNLQQAGESEFKLSFGSLVNSKCFVDPVLDMARDSLMDDKKVQIAMDLECRLNPPQGVCGIPPIVHFILGPHFKPHHYISIKSVYDLWKPYKIYIHTDTHFPVSDGLFIKMITEVQPILVKSRDALRVMGNRVYNKEHKADVVRLEILIRKGGIYIDTDVFAFKPIFPLLSTQHNLIMSQEDDRGLNNGIILARRCSPFLRKWYADYKKFRATDWNWNSIKRPLAMYRQERMDLHLTSEFDVSWNNNTIFHRPAKHLKYKEKYYCKHLFIRDMPQSKFRLEDFWTEDSDYGKVVRAILNGKDVP